MAIEYPTSGIDTFNTPSEPEGTPLSEAGSSTRNHDENHEDLGLAVMALETNAAPITHDHSGTDPSGLGLWPTEKLPQVNTHQNPDTDLAQASIHHTLGPSGLQAAPGNHTHYYNQILLDPYIICTSTTRPSQPFLGMIIFETDTNTMRLWAEFPTNPTATGVIGSDNFNRVGTFDLDTTFWEPHYLIAPTGFGYYHIWPWVSGFFFGPPYTPYFYSAWWAPFGNEFNWTFHRRVHPDDYHTDSDDQEFTCVWGDHPFDVDLHYDGENYDNDPCNDQYFRCSDDGTQYVRASLHRHYIVVFYTLGGRSEEISLGQFDIPDWEPRITWTLQALDWGFYFFRNGVQCGSIFDNLRAHRKDSDHRGWGFGCGVPGHTGGQYRPPDVINCAIKDNTSYSAVARWGLLPVASVPILVAEANIQQQIQIIIRSRCIFGFIREDWFQESFFQESETDMTIAEPGVYHVHASICWDPQRTYQTHSAIHVTVNGQDINRVVWNQILGQNVVPGYSQTQEINFWWRFNAGDIVRVECEHNGLIPCWLWYDPTDPSGQQSHVELVFHSP
jgi:hypothetical protein